MRSNLLLALLWCIPSPAQEPAAPAPIALAPVRWQSLPRGVERVFVGPDGRTWYQSDSDRAGATGVGLAATVEDVKRQIERAFRAAAPHVADVEILLFEPGGRVWFSFNSDRLMMVLGYDGRSWTDYPILQRGDRIAGHCATRGSLLEGRANRFAGGTAWFITFRGVLRFDGQRWEYRKFADRPDGPVQYGNAYPNSAVWLAVSPDGRTAAAYAGTTGAFWAFRGEEWEPLQFAINDSKPAAGSRLLREELRGLAMPAAGSAWILSSTGLLHHWPLTLTIKDLIAALKDDRFAARDAATRQLQAMGPSIRGAVEKALGESADLEQKTRLRSILGRIAQFDPMAVETTFGDARVAGCRQLYEDGAGRLIATATRISGSGSGVAILERDGRAAALMGEEFASAWALSNGDDRPPILAPAGDRVWLANRRTGEPPRLLDLKRGAFVGQFPYPEFSRFHAVTAEGRVFVSVAMPGGIRPIEVYTPGAPDPAVPLEISQVPLLASPWAITDVGSIWAHGPTALARFDGLRWADIRPSSKEQPEFLLPGRRDAMLLWSEPAATLYEGSRELGTGERLALLRQHRPRIEEAFGPGDLGGRGLGSKADSCGVRVDRAGNVWCWEPTGRLRVEVAGAWSDADDALTAAGLKRPHVTGVVPVGDGSKLYIRAQDAGKIDGHAFFAELEDGKPLCVAAPRDVAWFRPPRNLFDRDGGFWIGTSSVAHTSAFRVGRDGAVEELRDVGIPLLADEAGAVWLCEVRGRIQDHFRIWRRGQPAQKLVIPKVDVNTFFFSDRPGSVYARTVAGLQHLVADGPDFDSYRLDEVHPVEGILGQTISQGYSRHGYLAVVTALDSRTAPHYRLYLIRLPQ